MSVEAMAWAMRADLTGKLPAEHRLVLLVLADHASSDGTGAYPAKPRIAARLGTSERSVVRALRALEARGLISPGDQRMVAHIPTNRRPTVWTLRLGSRVNQAEPTHETPGLIDPVDNWGDTTVTPPSGVTPVATRGDTCGTPGVTPLSPKPKTEPPSETTPLPPASARPPCEHGQPGGEDLHPRTNKPRCPLCRTAPTQRMAL